MNTFRSWFGRTRIPLTVLVLGAVSVLAALFRWIHLANSPAWDADEGYNWSIATNLLAGHVQRFAMQYTFVDHPPLFYFLGAAVMAVLGTGLLPLRLLSTTCSVLTIPALYGLGTSIGGRRLGLFAAMVYAFWPQAIVQSRWAYTYNLLALLVPLALWAALHPVAPRRQLLSGSVGAGLLAGCALATDQEGVAVVVAVVAALAMRGGRAALAGLFAAAIPPVLYLSWMLIWRGQALLFDIQHTALRFGGSGGISEFLPRIVHLWQIDTLTFLGTIGLAVLPPSRAKWCVTLGQAVLAVIALKVYDPNLAFRAVIPLLPLFALGCAVLVERFWLATVARRRAPQRARRLAAMVLCIALLSTLVVDGLQAAGGYQPQPATASGLPQSPAAARAMAAWVNARVRPQDYVIAMPQIAWLLHCRTAEILEAVAITGQGTAFYPAGLSPTRFVWDPRLQAARYLIVDHFTRLWIASHPAERALVRHAQTRWRLVYRQGEYAVYANPHPQSSPW
jgi:4-amino-4-deoxy-L-arabinose transferase-like glycosyltransferase